MTSCSVSAARVAILWILLVHIISLWQPDGPFLFTTLDILVAICCTLLIFKSMCIYDSWVHAHAQTYQMVCPFHILIFVGQTQLPWRRWMLNPCHSPKTNSITGLYLPEITCSFQTLPPGRWTNTNNNHVFVEYTVCATKIQSQMGNNVSSCLLITSFSVFCFTLLWFLKA